MATLSGPPSSRLFSRPDKVRSRKCLRLLFITMWGESPMKGSGATPSARKRCNAWNAIRPWVQGRW